MNTRESNARPVYSTEHGRICPNCGQPAKGCACGKKGRKASRVKSSAQVPADGIVRVGRSTKGRKGKGVTTITGLAGEPGELKQLVKQLKQKCGTGGAVRDGVVEIQGDHRDLLVEELKGRGFTVKRSGG